MRVMKGAMRVLCCGFSLIACAVAWAGANEFMGYGSGDNLQEALVAAKVNAIHNAGGNVEIVAEAQEDDKLLADGGKSENEACLISYEITEKGESFDGTYVRIKAIISKNEDYKLKDGIQEITGSGVGARDREALVMAISDAVFESGARIKVFAKFEGEEMVADEASFSAKGIVTASAMESKDQSGGNSAVKVKCKIASESVGTVECSAKGGAEDLTSALAVARRNLILGAGSEWTVHANYKDGTLSGYTTKREKAAHVYFVRISDVETENGKTFVKLAGRIGDTASSDAIIERQEADGCGYGKTLDAAYKAALIDAIADSGCEARAMSEYDHGREIRSTSSCQSERNYFGDRQVTFIKDNDGFQAKVKAVVGGALPEVAKDIAQTVEVKGFGASKSIAVKDAKQRAVDSVFGCAAMIRIDETDGVVTTLSYDPTHSDKGYVDEYEVLSEDDSFGEKIVVIRAIVKNHDGDSGKMGWVAALILIVVATGILAAGKSKWWVWALWSLLVGGLFGAGHWIVASILILMALGARKS